MIHFHFGRSGQTWPCAVRLVREARDAGKPVFLLVPQQYTLSAEKLLMEQLGTDGFFDVDVVSPTRLTQRVFTRAGGLDRVRIDSQGKAMAVAGVLTKEKDNLLYYASAVGRQGLSDRVGQMIAELKRAHILPADLDDYTSSLPDGALKDKMTDLVRLYTSYEALLEGRFVDGEDTQAELLRRIPLSDEMQRAHLIVCGFDVLTEEMGRIAVTQAQLDPVDIVLCSDLEDDAFAPVSESVLRLMETIPGQADITRIEDTVPAPEDIAFLEKNLLSMNPSVYPAPPSSIRLYAAPTPYAEAYHVAEEMLSLMAKGVPFRDMGVLCGEEKHYFGALEQVLTACRIPHHLNRKLIAAHLGPGRFLILALTAVANRYYPEDMIRLIKTGYLPITPEEAFRMENYILACGIRGNMFTKPFSRGTDANLTAAMEEARCRMMAPLEQLRRRLKEAKNADESLTAIFTFLTDTDAYGTMNAQAKALEEEGKLEEASQLTQVWKTLMSLLDQMHELSGGGSLTGADAARLLEAGLTNAELSALPQNADSVICGVMGNGALTRPDYLFIMGLNDSILSRQDNDLMSEDERSALEDKLKAHLTLDQNGKLQMARLDVYKAMTNAGKRLYLSHAQALQDGTALRQLDLLRTIRNLFPGLVEEGGVTAPQGPARPMALLPALEGMGERLRQGMLGGEWEEAWHYLCARRPEEAQAILRLFGPGPAQPPLPAEVAHQLFLDRVSSVHRIESFAVCPFRHFLRYGLKPQERAEWRMQAADTGSFYHRALEGFTRLLPSLPDWPKVTRRDVERLMDTAAQEAVDPMMSALMEDSSVQRSQFQRYRRLLFRVGWTFTLAAQHSAFRQYQGDAELRFGYEDGGLPPVKLTLSDGSTVLVRGIIDRVERCQGDEGLYFRVIDFKMPDMTLEPERIFWGTQLQLLIYLNAMMTAEPDSIPGGAYYFHLADPFLPDPGEKADIEVKLAQALSLNGVTLRDVEVIRLMDDGKPPISMPALLKADGDFAKNKQLATLEEMRCLTEHAKRIAAKMAEGIRGGVIQASPLTVPGQESPCARCRMREICRDRSGDSRVIPRLSGTMSFDELIEKVTRGEMPENMFITDKQENTSD